MQANVNYGKKAQLKIQQTAFMLVFLTIFFGMVGIIFINVWVWNMKKVANALEENKAVIMSQFLHESSEFSCGSFCVDTDKILFLNSTLYKNLWDINYIKIRKVYPEENIDKICNKANYPDCGIFEYNFKSQEGLSAGSFVALCRYERTPHGFVTKKCELGKFLVGYAKKV